MKKILWFQKDYGMTVKTFLLYLFILCLPLMLIISFFYLGNIKHEEQNYQKQLQINSEMLLKSVNEKLESFSSTGYTIFNSRWYAHYNTFSLLYQDEFDYLKRIEISDDLTAKLISTEYVSDILIITPTIDQIIHCEGWHTLKEYQDFYNDVTLLDDTITHMPVVKVSPQKEKQFFQILLTDPRSRFHNSVISILINKKTFSSYINDRLPEHAYVHFYNSDQTLYENGDSLASGFVIEPDQGGIIGAKFIYPNFQQIMLPKILSSYILLMLVVFLASFLVVAYITFRKVLSLNALLNRFKDIRFRSEKDAYRYIGAYIDRVSLDNYNMKTENSKLNEKLNQYFEHQREDLLVSMITNPHFTFDEEHSISWFMEGLPFVLVLLPSSTSRDITLSADCCSYSQFFTLPKHELYLVAWFANNAAAKKQLPLLMEVLEDHIPSDSQLLVSELLNDPRQLRDIYLNLVRKAKSHPNEKKSDGTIMLIKEYINEYYNNPNMSMKLLEERFGLVGTNISKKFKAETEKTFSDYLEERRISTAEYLLSTTDKSVSVISEEVGYNSYISFKRAFIRHNKVSPRSYREEKSNLDTLTNS